MTSQIAGQLEGILHIPDERQDGQLRDPLFPLREVQDRRIIGTGHRLLDVKHIMATLT